jgi:ERCC4-type nuclease
LEITADDRERQSGVPEILSAHANIDLRISRMPLGDYLVGRKLLFERKTLNDFIQSIIDGRIFSQANRLADSEYSPAIILEGTSKDVADRKMPREAIQGVIVNLSLIMGIPILRSMNVEETAKLLIYAGRQISETVSGCIRRSGYRPKGKRKRQLYILQGLPGIGKKRAELLLDKYGSVQEVFNADRDSLSAVYGIGDKTAEKIRFCIRESESKYSSKPDILKK